MAIEERFERWRQLPAQQGREVRTQHHTETVLLDVPAHDVFSLTPAVLPDCADARQPVRRRRATPLSLAEYRARRPISEQRSRNEVDHARIVGPRAERAQVDGQEQHIGPRPTVGETGGARQSCNASAAAEAEDRQPLDRIGEVEAVEQHGVEAGDGEARDRVGHDHVDVAKLDVRSNHGLYGYFLEKGERVALECCVSVLPAMRL